MSYFAVENEQIGVHCIQSKYENMKTVSRSTVMLEQELTQEMPSLIVHTQICFSHVHFSLTLSFKIKMHSMMKR